MFSINGMLSLQRLIGREITSGKVLSSSLFKELMFMKTMRKWEAIISVPFGVYQTAKYFFTSMKCPRVGWISYCVQLNTMDLFTYQMLLYNDAGDTWRNIHFFGTNHYQTLSFRSSHNEALLGCNGCSPNIEIYQQNSIDARIWLLCVANWTDYWWCMKQHKSVGLQCLFCQEHGAINSGSLAMIHSRGLIKYKDAILPV